LDPVNGHKSANNDSDNHDITTHVTTINCNTESCLISNIKESLTRTYFILDKNLLLAPITILVYYIGPFYIEGLADMDSSP
jgi:hypothetical protein